MRWRPYYDLWNVARCVPVPVIYNWIFNDDTCPPTSILSSFNVITAPKTWLLALTTGHNTTPEQTLRMDAWMEAFLKSGQPPAQIPPPLTQP
jgi:cephalosporin-C deacetylase-like acetyl esterase